MINVSGNQSSRIFNINGPGAFTSMSTGSGSSAGKTTASGGALLNVGEYVTLTSCTFTNNTAVGQRRRDRVGRGAATTADQHWGLAGGRYL